jgi:hypothetical protein
MRYYSLPATARLTRQQNRRSTTILHRAGRDTSAVQVPLIPATTRPGSAALLPDVARQGQVASGFRQRKEEADGH